MGRGVNAAKIKTETIKMEKPARMKGGNYFKNHLQNK